MQLKQLRGFSRYFFGKGGAVFYKKKDLSLHPFRSFSGNATNGYCKVHLTDDQARRKTFYLHRIIAKLFLQNPHNKPQVNHKDGNKLNNSVANLEWVTQSENDLHAFKIGLKSTQGVGSKLTKEQVLEIRKFIKKGEPLNLIARIYEVDPSTISRIKSGENWKWL